MKSGLVNGVFIFAYLLGSGFTRPEYAPEFVPSVAEGKAETNVGTYWSGKFDGSGFITIDLGKETKLQGVSLTDTNLKKISVKMGNDPKNLTPVLLANGSKVIELEKEDIKKTRKIGFNGEESGRYLQIDIQSIYGRTIKFGEMDVIFVIF